MTLVATSLCGTLYAQTSEMQVRSRMVAAPAELPDLAEVTDRAKLPEPAKLSGLPEAPDARTIRGVVSSGGGGSVAGAHIQLVGQDQKVLREATTAVDGTYVLSGLPSGDFVVSVSMDGFHPAAYGTRLPEEGGTAEVNITLHIVGASESVDVVASQADIAEAELRLQTQQRLAGVFPNFYVSYQWHAVPMTSGQKFKLAFKNASDPGNLMLVGTVAGVQQAMNTFPGYGQGAAGYGRRFGADLGNLVAGTFMGGAILPSIFHQDPRYFYRGAGSTKSRLWYASTRVFVTRGDNGRQQPNWSAMLGDMSAGAISNLYYAPEDRRGASLTVVNGLLGIAGDAMNGVFQEFFLKKLTTNTKSRNGKASTSDPLPQSRLTAR